MTDKTKHDVPWYLLHIVDQKFLLLNVYLAQNDINTLHKYWFKLKKILSGDYTAGPCYPRIIRTRKSPLKMIHLNGDNTEKRKSLGDYLEKNQLKIMKISVF